jgi:heme/copper-type cytochrome/quinol oxidase subunit 2
MFTTRVYLAAFFTFTVIFIVFLLYYDYKRHKKPLTDVDPGVHYSFMHHVRVVTIPLFRYRISFQLSRVNPLRKDGVHKF